MRRTTTTTRRRRRSLNVSRSVACPFRRRRCDCSSRRATLPQPLPAPPMHLRLLPLLLPPRLGVTDRRRRRSCLWMSRHSSAACWTWRWTRRIPSCASSWRGRCRWPHRTSSGGSKPTPPPLPPPLPLQRRLRPRRASSTKNKHKTKTNKAKGKKATRQQKQVVVVVVASALVSSGGAILVLVLSSWCLLLLLLLLLLVVVVVVVVVAGGCRGATGCAGAADSLRLRGAHRRRAAARAGDRRQGAAEARAARAVVVVARPGNAFGAGSGAHRLQSTPKEPLRSPQRQRRSDDQCTGLLVLVAPLIHGGGGECRRRRRRKRRGGRSDASDGRGAARHLAGSLPRR